MGRKSKYSKDFKIKTVKRYLSGEASSQKIANEIGTCRSIVREWAKAYKAYGDPAFDARMVNASYTAEFKMEVVQAYLNGEGSYHDIAIKYGVPAKATVKKWVDDYNSHIELKDYIPGKKDIYMTKKCRETTLEERTEIVRYCLDHDRDYSGTAALFDVTYSNVYSWTKKYVNEGEEGLRDKRGHHKTVSEEEMDETELLRRKLAETQRKLEYSQLEVRLLKKVQEVERRRSSERADMKAGISRSRKRRKKR